MAILIVFPDGMMVKNNVWEQFGGGVRVTVISLALSENWIGVPGTSRDTWELRRGKWVSKGKEEQTTERIKK